MKELNRDSYVRGNTVLVPEYNPIKKYDDEKYKKLEKVKKEAQLKMRKQETKQKLLVLRMIACVFVVGIVLLLRYVSIYKMQAELKSYKTQISNLKAENESFRLILAKSSNIKSVEETAVDNLHMVRANPLGVLMVDLTKKNFSSAQTNKAPSSILDKLKQILF